MNSSNGKITIRKAKLSDIEGMCSLLAELFSIEADFTNDSEKQARALRLLIEEGDRSLVLAADNGSEVIGMCSVQTLISTSEGGQVGLVEDVVVRKDFRGKGVGSALLEQIILWCEQRGMTRSQLLADCDNREALDFYDARKWSRTKLICLRKFTSLKGAS